MGRHKAPLTERDFEVLGALIAAQDERKRYYTDRGQEVPSYTLERGYPPREFGGTDGSHHSLTASKLVKHGMAESRRRWGNWESSGGYGPKEYRPTEAGREALARWQEMSKALS